MRKYFYVELMDGHVDMVLAERWYYAYGKMRIIFEDYECMEWSEGDQEWKRASCKVSYDDLSVKCIYPWREYKPILRAEHMDAYVLKKARTFNDCPISIPAGDALRMNLGNLLDEYHKFDKLGE